MIRKAKLGDLDEIMAVIKDTIEEMHSYGNYQWDENYPQARDFSGDIEKGELYVEDMDGHVAGFICVNYVEPREYEGLNWSLDEKSMIIHRMAVNMANRKQGVGSKLMKFAEELALENEVRYLKTDTYSINDKMNAMFKKFGFKLVGEMSFLGKEKPFYCYDKIIKS